MMSKCIFVFPVCGGTKTVTPGAAESFIFSPGYGVANYSSNVQCEWVIENSATTNTSMYLDWDDGFAMEGPAQNCQYDYVEIRSGRDMDGIIKDQVRGHFVLP